jgi:hypothetical protein
MDNFTKNMAGLAVGMGSLALVANSMRMIPKDMMQMPKQRPMGKPMMMPIRPIKTSRAPLGMYKPIRPMQMKPMARPMMKPTKFNARASTGNMVKGMTGLMVGTALLGATASMINSA